MTYKSVNSRTCLTTDERGCKIQIEIWIIGSNERTLLKGCLNTTVYSLNTANGTCCDLIQSVA